MKQDIHPEYMMATVHCACGNVFKTRSTQSDIHLDVCSVCHPFFTGKQRLVDTAGRVDRFNRKYGAGKAGKKATAEAGAGAAAGAGAVAGAADAGAGGDAEAGGAQADATE